MTCRRATFQRKARSALAATSTHQLRYFLTTPSGRLAAASALIVCTSSTSTTRCTDASQNENVWEEAGARVGHCTSGKIRPGQREKHPQTCGAATPERSLGCRLSLRAASLCPTWRVRLLLAATFCFRGNKEGTESLLVNFRADHSTGSSAARSSGALLGARLHNFKALLFAFLARGPPPCPTFAALRLCVPVQPARLPLAGGVTGARHSQPLVAPLVAPQDANHSKQACFWQYQRLLKEPLQFRAPRIRAAARSQSQKDARGSAPRSRKE